jgi:haloalkane dehalogenase
MIGIGHGATLRRRARLVTYLTSSLRRVAVDATLRPMPTLTPADAADLFRREPDGFIEVGGAQIAHRRVGSGPDVLFVHGWPVSGATFRKLLPHLVDHVTCHVVDLPGVGSSRYSADSPLSLDLHIAGVRRVIDELGLTDVAVVGHDSGGMIARHAVAGDGRVRSMGLIDTEQPQGTGWRFNMFLAARHMPGLGAGLGRVAGMPRLRSNGFVLGDAFVDRSLLDGEFDEFFLKPLHTDRAARVASVKLLRSFNSGYVKALADLQRKIDVPVQLVWGEHDKFFPVAGAREMVGTFADAQLTVVPNAGLFAHEERPTEVAAALLPVLLGSR